MSKDAPNLLDVLKAELNFLEGGNYRHPRKNAWRPQLIFEDSPTCLSYNSPEKQPDCPNCALTQLAPEEYRGSERPCRHVPLSAAGATLESLYESADQSEIEETVARWLRSVIRDMEKAQAAGPGRRLSKSAGKS